MLESCENLAFEPEAADHFEWGQPRADELDGNFLFVQIVRTSGSIHFAHATAPDERFQPPCSDACTDAILGEDTDRLFFRVARCDARTASTSARRSGSPAQA
jgi:hypothetical protein